ncbi:regulatory protein RecX [Leucobacter sp. UT-8R-CII-1-4]|uniref:regulatory protein RecX n=1 Tax=Leucobacter sp. UT-8R-CII-1-4 TaxID=3040075 RepID=UPI0024A7BB55|nr:regulatory protein RecX [Leucobacter sp. UT-8R-CII-1-4]MDI6022944.1 regulatory protein RecX [Leucobacter sp. UT-8R-CII-1-4]
MAVRFLPPPSDESSEKLGVDRENLAEVIEFRSKLRDVSASDSREAQNVREPRQLRLAADAGSAGAPIEAGFGESGFNGDCDTAVTDRSESGLDELVHELENTRTAMDDAVRMLARRARSSGELRRELVAKGHDHAEVDEVVLECESRLYLDDLGLARVVTENLRTRKRASRSQIRIKLRERLLPDGVIEEAIGELDQDEENEILREAASERARKMGGLDRQTAERRLIGFLARRGWSGERAVRIAREALDRNEQRPGSSIGERRANTLSAVPKPKSGNSSVRFQ